MRAIRARTTLVWITAIAGSLLSLVLGGAPLASAQTIQPAVPFVTVAPTGPAVSPNGLLAQGVAPDVAVVSTLGRTHRVDHDPRFKAWEPFPDGQRQQLEPDVKPSQAPDYGVCAYCSVPTSRCTDGADQSRT